MNEAEVGQSGSLGSRLDVVEGAHSTQDAKRVIFYSSTIRIYSFPEAKAANGEDIRIVTPAPISPYLLLEEKSISVSVEQRE